jgi:hypothetical protein
MESERWPVQLVKEMSDNGVKKITSPVPAVELGAGQQMN